MKSRGRQKILACVMAALAFSSTPMSNARAQDVLTISSGRTSLITVEKGKPKTIRTHSSFYEIVVGDPEIANVQPLTNRSFYVLGINAGTTGIALGVAGLPALADLSGTLDLFGRALQVTQVAVADELASAASLLMGQAAEGQPAVLVRGFASEFPDGNSSQLTRTKEDDLFRAGKS